MGDYTGQLDNVGGLVVLLDAAGAVVDSVGYDDRLPLAGRRRRPGRRGELAAAGPAAADRPPVPGRLAGSGSATTCRATRWPTGSRRRSTAPRRAGPTPSPARPPPSSQTLTAAPVNGQPLIRSTDEVVVRAGLSPYGTPADVRLEYFVDDLERTDETPTAVAMTRNGGQLRGPAAGPGEQQHRPLPHPGRPGPGLQVVSPRPSDPYPWHAYFVSPTVTVSQPPYHLFVKSTDWGQLWTNVNFSDTNDRRVVPESIGGSTVRCQLRASWDERVPAVFVVDGVVYDVRVRYQGSRWNRPNGNEIDLAAPASAPCPSR